MPYYEIALEEEIEHRIKETIRFHKFTPNSGHGQID